jgi:hypothetical protein
LLYKKDIRPSGIIFDNAIITAKSEINVLGIQIDSRLKMVSASGDSDQKM